MAAVIVMPGCAVSGCFSFPVQAGLVIVAGCAWRLLGMEFVGELFIVTHRTRTEAGIGRIISFFVEEQCCALRWMRVMKRKADDCAGMQI